MIDNEVKRFLINEIGLYERNGMLMYDYFFDQNEWKHIDEMIKNFIKKVNATTKKQFIEELREMIYDSFTDFEMDKLNEYTRAIVNEFEIDYDEAYDYISENVELNYKPIFDKFMNSTFNAYVALTDTNDEMNYDFSENYIGDDMTYEEFEELHSSYKFLCESQGYDLKDLYDCLFTDIDDEAHDTNSKFILTLADEIANVMGSNRPAFVFLLNTSLADYINYKFDGVRIQLSATTACGLFDWTNGSGSLLEVDLEDPITIPIGQYEIYYDGEMGYSIHETYGLTSSMWNVGKILKASKTDSQILESLINKYGKDVILNELEAGTYYRASKEADKRGQMYRAATMRNAANNRLDRTSETSDGYVNICDGGFEFYVPDYDVMDGDTGYYQYIESRDRIVKSLNSSRKIMQPGEIRSRDRKFIAKILKAFNAVNPDSQWNNRQLWIK